MSITKAFHMGPKGLKDVDPAFQGAGADRRKFMKTGKPQTPVAHAYLGESEPEDVVVASGGTHKHHINVDMSKLYNITKDEKQHMARAQHDMAQGNYKGNPIDAQDLARTRIKEEGYHGLHRESGAGKHGSVELFHKHPVIAEAAGGKIKKPDVVGGIVPSQVSMPKRVKFQEGPNANKEAYVIGNTGSIQDMLDITNGPTLAHDNYVPFGPNNPLPKHKVIQQARPAVKGKHVFTANDTHPDIEHNEAQKKLIHGIDLKQIKQPGGADAGSTADFTVSGKAKNHSGKNVHVKGQVSDKDLSNYIYGDKASFNEHKKFTMPQREALYHNLAHHLGMGEFVPTTSTIKDPATGTHYSAMQMVPHGEHYERGNEEHESMLQHHMATGDLHKLALMNALFGNTDRHGGNFMMSPDGIKMIDHGLTFDYSGGKSGRNVFTPHYIRAADGDEMDVLHGKAAEWLMNLKSKDLTSFFKKNKVPAKIVSTLIKSVQAAKNHVESSENPELGGVLDAIKSQHGSAKRKGGD